jgi:hypothetical protein
VSDESIESLDFVVFAGASHVPDRRVVGPDGGTLDQVGDPDHPEVVAG